MWEGVYVAPSEEAYRTNCHTRSHLARRGSSRDIWGLKKVGPHNKDYGISIFIMGPLNPKHLGFRILGCGFGLLP